MQKTEDVQRLLSVLREYEDNLRMLPKDFIQMTVRALECLLKERDAAVNDMRVLGRMGENTCSVCANRNHGEGGQKCIGCLVEDNWEWRGVTKEGGADNAEP